MDIKNSPIIFVGITVLLVGDFTQTLPVITNGIPAVTIKACLKRSTLWQHVKKMPETNMRVHLHNDTNSGYYVDVLHKISESREYKDENDTIMLKPKFLSNKKCRECKLTMQEKFYRQQMKLYSKLMFFFCQKSKEMMCNIFL